ncbi:MAG: DUF4166 domain-containing protein [Alphaproteobacteria bacterium]
MIDGKFKWCLEKEKAVLSPHHDNDFRHLVKGGGWANLTQDIINRFDSMNRGEVHYYGGQMEISRSFIGYIFAWLCKAFGSPLIAHKGDAVSMEVNAYPVAEGICWQRIYRFAGKKPISVRTTKIINKKHGLLECAGNCLNMRLDVYEQNRALHFVSNKYLIQIGQYWLPIPHTLTPGELHVEHIDEGQGRFRFRMSMTHKWFGQTFYQDGVFEASQNYNAGKRYGT